MNEKLQYYIGTDGKSRLIPNQKPNAKPIPYRIVIRRAWIAICLVPVLFVTICSIGAWGYHKNWHQDLWKELLTIKSERVFSPLQAVPRKVIPGPTKAELGPEPHSANAIPVLPPQGPEGVVSILPPQEISKRTQGQTRKRISQIKLLSDERQEARVRRREKKVTKLKRDLRRAEVKMSKCRRDMSRYETTTNNARVKLASAIRDFEHEEELRRQDLENKRRWRSRKKSRLSQDHRSIRLRRRDVQFARDAVADAEADTRRARVSLDHVIENRNKIARKIADIQGDPVRTTQRYYKLR